ncbi:MAG: hypothetical protein IPG47_16550 [Thermoflexaceae bacterium]|nr:hypothetical protein [Thermoflexaceae bacterium]
MVSLPRVQQRPSRRRRQHSADDLRFELGMRSAVDHLAPAAIEASRSHLVIDGRYVRVLGLSDYPRYVHPNWLARLIDFDEPLDLSLHIDPLDSATTVRRLTHKLVELQSSRLLDARSGKIASAEREVAYEDVERLRDALQRGEERVFSVSLYVCLRSGSPAAVDELNRRVETALGGMMASSRAVLFEMLQGLLSCLPAGRDYLGRYRNLDTTSAATMIPFTSSHLSMREGILYGISVHNNSLVIFDPFSRALENANKVVFAKSGAGKSYACKVEALRALMRGVEYYIIDPEDEYGRICESVGGQYIRLSGSSAHHINPFDLGSGSARDGEAQDALTERLLALQGLFGLMLADKGGSSRSANAEPWTALYLRPTAVPGSRAIPVPTEGPRRSSVTCTTCSARKATRLVSPIGSNGSSTAASARSSRLPHRLISTVRSSSSTSATSSPSCDRLASTSSPTTSGAKSAATAGHGCSSSTKPGRSSSTRRAHAFSPRWLARRASTTSG